MAKAASGGRKTDVLEYEERMVEVFEMLLYQKLSFTEFRTQAAEKFGITQRSAETLYKEGRERLKDKFSQEHDEILNEQIGRLYDLLNRCRTNGNRKIEAEVLRDLNKIYGLDAPKKLDITSNGESISVNINLNNE